MKPDSRSRICAAAGRFHADYFLRQSRWSAFLNLLSKFTTGAPTWVKNALYCSLFASAISVNDRSNSWVGSGCQKECGRVGES